MHRSRVNEEFLRRAYVDAIGFMPTPEKIRSFVADTDLNKRDKLIDSLIGTEEFADQWAYYYGELFRTRAAVFPLLDQSMAQSGSAV